MAFDAVKIDGVNAINNQTFFPSDCQWPITDWIQNCPADEVLAAFPMREGFFYDGISVPMLTGASYAVDTTGVTTDNCNAPEVNMDMTTCAWLTPGMKEISIQTPQINLMDFVTKFCRSRSILPGQLCIFNPDGSFAAGNPLTVDFAQWLFHPMYAAWGIMLGHTLMKGDDARAYQVDGLYTQLDGGWAADPNAAAACPTSWNTNVVIDWAALTDTAGGPATVEAVTGAGKTLNLWGTTITLPAGINFAKFLDMWVEIVGNFWTNKVGGVSQWEMHSRPGFARCLAELSACMQPCGLTADNIGAINDPQLRQRFAEAHNTSLIKLYPSGRVIPNLQTGYLEPNQLRFGPRTVGGRPTYMSYWDNLDRYFSVINGSKSDDLFGFGQPQNVTPMLDNNSPRYNLEDRAVVFGVNKTTLKCLRAMLLARIGVLVCSRHLWLRVDNIACANEDIYPSCDNHLTVDGVALN